MEDIVYHFWLILPDDNISYLNNKHFN